MKDKRVFFNPVRMLSPKLDSESVKLEELYQHPVSETLTLEEGLLIMLSKLVEMARLVKIGFMSDCPDEIKNCEVLADEVHQQEKVLTGNLACTITDYPEMCRAVILFPGELERIGDFLEGILNCCKIKTRDSIPMSDKNLQEVGDVLETVQSLLKDLRDIIIAPNKHLIRHVIERSNSLDQKCQEMQLSHIDRLLEGSTAPKASSLYLDILESIQSIKRHIREMAKSIQSILPEEE
ncbi:MAG: hypothetical protein AB7V04_09905 [Desulfomonilaceae bacterium]